MPADARYVCIHYCTPSEGFWFMVDDVFIGVENPAAVKAEASSVRSYEVLVDDVKVGSTVETSYVLTSVTPGQHVAKVVAVYDGGRSPAAVHAFTVDQSVTAAQLEAVVREAAGANLESIELFDVFTGEQVGEGKKSLAFAVTFRSPSKTLSAEDSEAIRKAIVDKAEAIGAQLRA